MCEVAGGTVEPLQNVQYYLYLFWRDVVFYFYCTPILYHPSLVSGSEHHP
jgi:hypothetical protein